jgi:outer membrane receptor protein involved in Fe transport
MKTNNINSKINRYLGILILLVISASFTDSYAQHRNFPGTISGTVLDNNGNAPLEQAVIRIFKSKDSTLVTGELTDAQGNFSIKVPYGNFKVEATYTGYKKHTQDGISVTSSNPSITLETIKLSSSDISTEEITIEGQKPLVEITPEKKVINVENNLVTKGESAIDLLKKIPMVTIDNSNNVILRGSPNVKLLINGKESALTDNLDQMPADMVKNIELITNPPAKYESEGLAGIINIVLKEDEKSGMNGMVNLGAGTYDKYNGSANFNLKKDKFTVSGNYYYGTNYNTTASSTNLVNSLNSPTYTNQNDLSTFKRRFQYFSGDIDYKFNQNQSLNLRGFFGFGRFNGSDNGQNYILNNLQNLTSYFTKDNQTNTSGHHYNLSLTYDGKFKQNEQLSGNLSYSLGKFDNTLNQTLQYYDGNYVPINNTPYIEIDNRDNTHYFFNSQLDFVKPFSKDSKLELGYKGVVRSNDINYVSDTLDYNTNQYVENLDISNDFNYREQIYALYAEYGNSFGNFSFNAGLRAEQTFTKGFLVTTNQAFTSKYLDFFPTLNLMEKLGKVEQIQASYSRRINRPNNFRLNPFVNNSDPLNPVYGNPYLKPEYTDSYELNFVTAIGNTSITPSLFLRKTKNQMTKYATSTDSNVTIWTFENLGSSTSSGLDLIIGSQILKWWNLNATMSFYNLSYEGGNIDNFSAPSGFTFKGNFSTFFNLPNLFNLQLFYNYQGKNYTSQGTLKPIQSFDVGISRTFFNNSLTVMLKANDIFKTLDYNSYTSGLGFSQTSTSTYNSRGLLLTLTYNFGKQEKSNNKKKPSNNDNNKNDILNEDNQ